MYKKVFSRFPAMKTSHLRSKISLVLIMMLIALLIKTVYTRHVKGFYDRSCGDFYLSVHVQLNPAIPVKASIPLKPCPEFRLVTPENDRRL